MRYFRADSKSVLRFKNRACELLQAYTTNTLEGPRNAFVGRDGRLIAVVEQRVLSSDEVLMALEKPFVGRLVRHLDKYLKLYDTEVREEPGFFVYYDLEKKSAWITPKKLEADVSEEQFRIFRLKNAWPVQGVDFDEEMILNVADEGLVSYTKGCYLGQEVVARVHWKGKPTKRLVVRFEDECNASEKARMTSKALDPETGRVRGFVLVNHE